MTEEHLKEIQDAVGVAIKTHVNGKIDRINDKFDAYIKSDMEWKEKAQPVLDMGNNVQGFGKVSLYILGFVASVAGAIAVIVNLLRDR